MYLCACVVRPGFAGDRKLTLHWQQQQQLIHHHHRRRQCRQLIGQLMTSTSVNSALSCAVAAVTVSVAHVSAMTDTLASWFVSLSTFLSA